MENDWRQQNVEEYFRVKCHLEKIRHYKKQQQDKRVNLANASLFFLSDCYLAQHIILLHIVNLSGVDLPFEGVLKELAADIKQQGAYRSLVQRAAWGCLVVVAGGGDAVSQNHTYQQA